MRAIVLALFIGFHFQLETPRWAVLTAAIGRLGICRWRGNPIPALSVIADSVLSMFIIARRCDTLSLRIRRAPADDFWCAVSGPVLRTPDLFSTDRKLLCVGTVRPGTALDYGDTDSDGVTFHAAAICA